MATLRQHRSGSAAERAGWDDVQSWIKAAGTVFPVHSTLLKGAQPEALPSGEDHGLSYKSNGVVFACTALRQRVFSQITWRFAGLNNGRVGKLFGTNALDVLSNPWPGGTTGDLATRMIVDADTKGAFYGVRNGSRIYRRDPMKISVILSGHPDEDEFVDILGFVYRPKGKDGPAFSYTPDEMCYWTPTLDADAPYQKGMSWITPVLREIRADNAATDHKATFFAQGGAPLTVVKTPESVMTQTQFDQFKAKMEQEYTGPANSYKKMYLAPGVDVEVVGANLQQMDFSNTQGRDETRIASAAGVPAVLVGLKESLAGSSLNQGNYQAARRSFADGTMMDLYRSAAGALETIVPAPQTVERPAKLWFDVSQVPFFHEDRADAAEIQMKQAQTLKSLNDAGYVPDSIEPAVTQEDFSLLKHTGQSTVQVQPTTTGGGDG